MAREMKKTEVQQEFISEVKSIVAYWNKLKIAPKEKTAGVAFSILNLIDGYGDLPAFILAPDPHKDDKEYNKSRGQDYFPENNNSKVNCDIAGGLHDLFYKK